MWDFILALLIGAAIPLVTLWLQSKEKRKYFELERREKMKLVAIEKRMEAHQQAIKHMELMRTIIHKPEDDKEKVKIITDANQFWLDYCLYLEKQTRSKFKEAIWIVSSYSFWLENYRDMEPGKKKDEEKEYFMARWDDFHKLFEIIQKEVELEPIKPEEDKTPEGELIKKPLTK